MNAFARFGEVDAAFDAALSLPPDAHAGHLASIERADPWMARRVAALLEAAAAGETFMSAGGACAGAFGAALSDAVDAPEAVPAGAIGHYRIVREIGRGGMSVVYLAHRDSADFDHAVAVKVLKRGLDTDEILRRFAQERRILASLDHPAIARLFDGGATNDGRPYIVMEYVQGRDIDRYCVERRLPLGDRLRVWLAVARAVEYAHQKLVVHRDLKPGNVLVSEDGRVKLLDFGIAKLLEAAVGDPPLTVPAQRLMTPEYASPEQRRGEPMTTASDVYQLGILLYELVVGQRPAPAGAGAPVATPAPSVAARLRSGFAVDRDLDSVVLKALAPEPQQRYGSVGQFADDIARYLESVPVMARPATRRYRLRKFVARHPGGVTAAVAFVLATIAYASVLTLQARELAAARDRAGASARAAQQVAQFMVDAFTLANPIDGEGASITARQLLDRGTLGLERQLADQPSVRAAMLRAAGQSYFGLGLNAEAEPLLRRSVELLRPLSASREALASSLTALGRLRHEQGEAAEARTVLTEALELRRALHGSEHLDVAESLHSLGRVEAAAANHAAAERLFRDALAMRERLAGPDSLEAARTRHNLGVTLQASGNLAAADALLREAVRVREAALGGQHPDTTDSMNALALLLREQGDAAAAEPLLRRALEANRARLGSRHPYVATNINNLALALRDLGRQDDAALLYREALDLLRAAYGGEHPRVAIALFNLGSVLQDLADYGAAEALFREALGIDRTTLGDDHVEVAVDRTHLGGVLHLKGETEEAERLLRQALARLRTAFAPNHPRVARAALGLGRLLVDTGRAVEAEPLLRAAATAYLTQYGTSDPRAVSAVLTLGRATATLGRFAEMEALVAARCRPVAGRYRAEVMRAREDLQRTLRASDAALAARTTAATLCDGRREAR